MQLAAVTNDDAYLSRISSALLNIQLIKSLRISSRRYGWHIGGGTTAPSP
jgi:hypothetical protein